MKLLAFLRQLSEISIELHQKEPQYWEYLGFHPYIQDTDKILMLKRGYWSTFFWGSIVQGEGVGSRIFPNLHFEEWSVQQNSGDTSFTISPSPNAFLASRQGRILFWEECFENVSKNWSYTKELASPFLSLLDGNAAWDLVESYAFDLNNKPHGDSLYDNQELYRMFWNILDTSHGHSVLRNLIDNLWQDFEYLPIAVPEGNLGCWETRIKNILMAQAEKESELYEVERVVPFLMAGFMQPHGYDPEEGAHLFHFPNFSLTSTNSLSPVLSYFQYHESEFPATFKDDLQFKAIKQLMGTGRLTYCGTEHYQAALELEAQGKPLEAWNALVSASYWAGVNGYPEEVDKHWQQAIDLCEKQNWTDAHEALTLQWEWYSNYPKDE